LSNAKDHRTKAEHNENFAATLSSPFHDWAVTVIFYAAVHYIEAYFAKEKPPYHSPNHPLRDSAIGKTAFLKPIWKDYRELKNQSGLARYEAHIQFGQLDVDSAKKRLDKLRKHIVPKL
jgi:hypothetical protein